MLYLPCTARSVLPARRKLLIIAGMPSPLAIHEWSPSQTDAGATAPIAILVHGITGWWRTWWRVGPVLAQRGFRVVAVDLPGHGDSPPIDGIATAETLASDLGAALDALGVPPVDLLLGHSLGAAVCMELAHRRTGITRRLVLEDPPGQTRADDLEFQDGLEREVHAARTDPDVEVRRSLAENPAWVEEDARQDVEGRARCDLEGILASLRANTGVRATKLAATLDMPTLYLIADERRSVLGAERPRLIRSLPARSDLVEFASGHVIHRDRFEAYVASILRWLEAA